MGKATYSTEVYRRFKEQRANARRRGIPFCFELDEWVEWWIKNLGPGWLKKRGPKGHKYCMARKGDKGPYCWGNVECVTCNVNHSTGNYGTTHNMTYLTEGQVKKIYLDHRKLISIAKDYGCTLHTVWDIKTKRYWKHVTKDLGPAPMRKATKVTPEIVRAIYQSDEDFRATATRYGIGRSTV